MDTTAADDVKAAFGRRIRLLRQRAGLSQEQLALKCGLDRTYVGGVERGERNISIVNIERIARALDLSLAELFDEEAGVP